MYEFLVLGQLSRRPMHGYLIAKVIDGIVGPHRQVQWGALYPVLARLEKEGLICVDGEAPSPDGRLRKVYTITETGLERLHEHLLDTEHHLGEYELLFSMKVSFFHQLTTAERILLARHYAVYAQRHLDHILRKERDVRETPLSADQQDDILTVLAHKRERWCQEKSWAEKLIAREHAMEVS